MCGSGFALRVRVAEGAGAFVCGEETALIASLESRRGMPRFRPPYPVERGLHGRPTVVNCVETPAVVPWSLRHGPGGSGHGSRPRDRAQSGLAEAWVRRGDASVDRGADAGERGEDPGAWYGHPIADYGKAIELDPGMAVAWMDRGNAHFDAATARDARGEDSGEDCVADFETAIRITPACEPFIRAALASARAELAAQEAGKGR